MSEQKEQEPQRFKVLERWAEYRRQLADAVCHGYTSVDTQNAIAAEMRPRGAKAELEELAEIAEAVEALQAASAELRGLLDRWAIAVQGFANQLAVVEQRVAALTLAADAMEDNLADERALNCRDRLHALESKMTDVESLRP